MSIGLEYFRWHCFEGGYEWRVGASIANEQRTRGPKYRDTRFLVERAVGERTRVYHPLVHHPTLFKEFAELEPTEAAFAAFAGAYGPLGVGHLLKVPVQTGQTGEPLSRWLEEWARLRAVVYALDAIQALDATTLERCVELRDTGARFRLEMSAEAGVFTHTAGELASVDAVRPWLWKFALSAGTRTERLARLASGWVQEAINESIDASRNDGEAAVPTRILFNHEEGGFTQHVVPRTLLAALWFQCARVLTEHPEFKKCEHCRKWLELSPDARRRNSKYCGDRCKVAAYRIRKAKRERKASRGRSRAKSPKPARTRRR